MLCRKSVQRVLFTALLTNLLASVPLLAHHSFAAEYDNNKPLILTGTVVKWELINQVAGAPVSGGMGDLQGDGFGGGLSAALNTIRKPNGHEVPTALIAGKMDGNNLAGLACMACGAFLLRQKCGDPLATKLTPTGWPTVFGQDSDGIVPLISQSNLSGPAATVPGLVHSSGLVGVLGLSFNGPNELDPLGLVNTIQTSVIRLLNAPTQSSWFSKLP